LDKNWRGRPVDHVWREIAGLKNSWDVNFIWDVSDSFTSSRDWVLNFAANRPSDINVSFFLYARSCELDSEMVDALAAIGCEEIFIGIESGDDALLRSANKGTTTDNNLQAACLLASRDIRMFPCFVLGLPGESQQSLEKTIHHAKILSSLCELSTVSASVLVPLPGSPAFSHLGKTPKGKSLLFDADTFNLEELGRLWVDTYCKASWTSIHDAINQILSLSPRVSSFFNFQHNLELISTKEGLQSKVDTNLK
jgi:anaerobic magnesium-protoporphyrin IX monomethyl ester cyclase